jgi:hypothetical protein
MDKWSIYYSNILIDNITETYEIQLPIKKQVEPNRLCYGSDLWTFWEKSAANTKDG